METAYTSSTGQVKRMINHVKKHHKHYLFGFGLGFCIVKVVMLLGVGVGVVEYNKGIFADFDDNIPDPIAFDAVMDAETSTEYNSNIVIIAGIDTGATVSVENGSYSINGGEFLTDAGTVNLDDQVILKVTTASEYESSIIANLVLGGTAYPFVLTTKANPTPEEPEPEVQLLQEEGTCEGIFASPLSGQTYRATIPVTFTLSGCEIASGTEITAHLLDKYTNIFFIGTANVLQTTTGFTTTLQYNSALYQTESDDGYRVYVTAGDGEYTSDSFLIDNEKPTITGISVQVTNANGGYVGLSGIVTVAFTADKELGTGTVVNVLGTNATLASTTGLIYTYTKNLSTSNTEGNIIYNIQYRDLVGNTGYYEGFLSTLFDKTMPTVTGLVLSGNNTGFVLSFTSPESVKYSLQYGISGSSNTTLVQQTQFATGHNLPISSLNISRTYTFTLNVYDLANNAKQITGYFSFDTAGNVRYRHSLMEAGSGTLVSAGFTGSTTTTTGTTATGSLISKALRNEILKYNECKEDIDFTTTKISIAGNTMTLQMPDFGKSYVKKLVSAFTVVMIERMQKQNLTEDQLEHIVKKFNNFLVVLKLMRDDDNACKQNLTNYHIEQFKQKLNEYNITVE